MAKRRLGIMALLFCMCLCWLPRPALAASTTEAKEPISTETKCDLTIYYGYDGVAFPGQRVQLYQIASVSADFQYTLTAPFADSGLILNGIQTNGEWNVIRSTLEVQILANNIAPTHTVETNEAGQALFSQLSPGLYLASSVTVALEDSTCFFDSALIALPGLGADGLWQYQVTAAAKSKILLPVPPEEQLQLKVLKLWKGDEGRTDRPQSIEVEIFRDGAVYQTVILSQDNNWSYRWTAPADGASWKVAEKNVPTGYTMTVEQRETTFVITNTRPDTPPPSPPQTGDTVSLLLYTVILYISGAMLILFGIAGKRNCHEETN